MTEIRNRDVKGKNRACKEDGTATCRKERVLFEKRETLAWLQAGGKNIEMQETALFMV